VNFTNLLWTVNIVGEVALVAAIVWRGEVKSYKAFTAWMAYHAVQSFVLLGFYPPDSAPYARAYFYSGTIETLLAMAVLSDLLYWVIKPYLNVGAAKSTFYVVALFALFSVAAIAALDDPIDGHWIGAIARTVNRSVEFALGGTVILLLCNSRMREKWNLRERGITLGLLYLPAQFIVTMFMYKATIRTAMLLDLAHMGVFTVALAIWLCHFLMKQGALRTIGVHDITEAQTVVRNPAEKLRDRA
jgi:hypothetical protein